MFKCEKRFLQFVESNIYSFVFLLFTILGAIVRYSTREFESGDMLTFLLGWYDQSQSMSARDSLSTQIGNYNVLYQFLIYVMTLLPGKALYKYKILSITFDYLLALLAGYSVYSFSNNQKFKNAILAYSVVLMCPTVWLNSSAWGQCDSIYTFWGVLALLLLCKQKYVPSFVCLGLSFSFKLQACFILPIYIVYYLCKKKFSILYFAILPITMIVVNIPSIIMGRNILSIFSVYVEQTRTYYTMHLNFPSFWSIFSTAGETAYNVLGISAVCITIFLLVLTCIYMIKRNVISNSKSIVSSAIVLGLIAVYFLPCMHERYAFYIEVVALLYTFVDRRTIPLAIALELIILPYYGHFLFDYEIKNQSFLSLIYFVVLILYMILLVKDTYLSQNDSESFNKEI